MLLADGRSKVELAFFFFFFKVSGGFVAGQRAFIFFNSKGRLLNTHIQTF